MTVLGEDWVCVECGNQIRVFVLLSEPPVCANPQKHGSRPQIMERQTNVVETKQ